MDVRHIAGERGGIHFGAGALRKLDCIGTHIARGTLHEHAFRAIQVSVINDHLPCRTRHDRH
jgi:hypothetical protein